MRGAVGPGLGPFPGRTDRIASAWAFLIVGIAGLASACSGLASVRALPPARFCQATTRQVLDAAIEILESKGYGIAETDQGSMLLIGEQVETVTRTRGSFIRGTIVKTQVVIEVQAREGATEVRATFNITFRRPTGERRTWVAETPPALRLRERFYQDLARELGVELGPQA